MPFGSLSQNNSVFAFWAAVSLWLPAIGVCADVRLQLKDGKRQPATLAEIVSPEGKISDSILEDLREISFKKKNLISDVPTATMLRFTNGDILFVSQFNLLEETVNCTFLSQIIQIPVEYLSEVTWKTTLLAYKEIELNDLDDDVVFLENNDIVRGTLTSVRNSKLQVMTDVGPLNLPLSGIRSVRFNPKLSEVREHATTNFQFYLNSGSVLTVNNFRFGKNLLDCELQISDTLKVRCPVAGIDRIELWDEHLVRVNEAHMVHHEGSSFWGTSNNYMVDRNVNRQFLISSGIFTTQGFGVASQSHLSFNIPDDARSFHFKVGVDQRARQIGTAECSVFLDGEKVWVCTISKSKIPSVEPLPISLLGEASATKPQLIELVVDFGTGADAGDLINWQQVYFRIGT